MYLFGSPRDRNVTQWDATQKANLAFGGFENCLDSIGITFQVRLRHRAINPGLYLTSDEVGKQVLPWVNFP